MAITLPKDATPQFIASIKRFAAEAFDEDISDLKARMMLDFFVKEIAPTVYNSAIGDAQKYFHERTLDLEGTCYEKEFGYWAPAAPRRS